MKILRVAALLGAFAAPAGCSGFGTGVALAPSPAGPRETATSAWRPRTMSPIRHVVFIIQENRSFDNLFQGYPGADTRSWGLNSSGRKVRLRPIPLEAPYDLSHFSYDFATAYDAGKMDGFDLEGVYGRPGKNPQYGYVPHEETKTYFEMAHRYVLADRMFTSHLDASYVSHQYAIAGQAGHTVDLPETDWGCDGGLSDTIYTWMPQRAYGPRVPVCFDYTTLGDELDAAGLTWRFYAPSDLNDWEPYQAIRHIRYGNDWGTDIFDNKRFVQDVNDGYLASVTWITPVCNNSDHSGCESNTGPHWVAHLVNAVGKSKFWDSSAIFVMWDEWGGWYDHVPPPQLDYDGLGFRVPLLIMSPYAKQRYVSHVQYEHGSVLRFIEDTFGLSQLAASDRRANDPASDCFDFTQPPRTFTPFDSRGLPADGTSLPDVRPADAD